jgi:C-terminal processing protease CtpA/Prc
MFNVFLRGHLLTKKFFTFLIGSTYFTNKNKIHLFNLENIALNKEIQSDKILNTKNFKYFNTPYLNLQQDALKSTSTYFSMKFKNCLKFLVKNINLSLNNILYFITLFNHNSIMYCDIPKLKKPYLGCSIRANDESQPGMKIIMIKSDSPAEKAGLKVKDIILEIDDKPVRSINEYNAAIGQEANKKKLKIIRNENGKDNIFIIEVEFIFSE